MEREREREGGKGREGEEGRTGRGERGRGKEEGGGRGKKGRREGGRKGGKRLFAQEESVCHTQYIPTQLKHGKQLHPH